MALMIHWMKKRLRKYRVVMSAAFRALRHMFHAPFYVSNSRFDLARVRHNRLAAPGGKSKSQFNPMTDAEQDSPDDMPKHQ